MYVCMYVCMYVRMYVCTCARMRLWGLFWDPQHGVLTKFLWVSDGVLTKFLLGPRLGVNKIPPILPNFLAG